jgi:hypothetical protein
MKKILMMIPVIAVSLQFFSCSTDYDGTKPENQVPVINIYDTNDITSSKKTKIQWYGNDSDGMKMKYYYTVTTDTTLKADNVRTALPVGGIDDDGNQNWSSTENTYAYISMPYGPYHSETVFLDSALYDPATYPQITDSITFKAVWSKFFVFGVDEAGKETETQWKYFKRTNRIPKHPMVYSTKLVLNGFDKYWMTVGPDSAQMVLPAQTSFWKNFDFKWMGEDPDGTDVELEFMWELWERERVSEVDNYISLAASSGGWSVNNLSVSFDDEIFNHNKQGQYAFKVFVRDDAFEESENHATINFEVFAPEFDKGILLIDDTDPALYPPASSLYMGNPESAPVTALYEELLEYAGFVPDSLALDNPLNGYKIKRFSKGTELVGYDYEWGDDDGDPATPEVIVDSVAVYRGVYDPGVREVTRYRLVIIASDDRGNLNGVDFAGQPPYTGYNQILSQYLDVGGNVFIAGPSVLMGKLYTSPNQVPINKYADPFRIVFDGEAAALQGISASTESFFNTYFGIYSVTFPEQKTYFTGNSVAQLCSDHYLTDNYDFIGTSVYEHISDDMIKPLRIDSARVKLAWWNRAVGTRTQDLALKDGGTVFTGTPSFEAYKGEVVYRYKSIYDLEIKDNDYSYEIEGTDTLKHFLWNWNYLTDTLHISDGSPVPVLRRSGSVGTRYIAEGDVFRTAFFTIPLYFLDNSENQVSDMFKAMIDWFDINNDGGTK